MAAKRTDEQKALVAEFVQQLYKLSRAPSWTEFARRAGVWSPNLSEWQTGTSIPDGWNLYSLIAEVARTLSGKAEATAGELAATAVAADVLEPADLRVHLRRLTEAVAATNAASAAQQHRLEQLERDLAERLPADTGLQSAGEG